MSNSEKVKKETEGKKVERSLCLELMDAKECIFGVINDFHKNHRIPFYLLESIVLDAARQVTACAETERKNELRAYEQKLAESKKDEVG